MEQRPSYRRGRRSGPVLRGESQLAGCPRLLLAQEDLEARTELAVALKQDGYAVTDVGTLEDLLATLARERTHGNSTMPFDALIASSSLPTASGECLLGLVRRIDPDLPVVLLASSSDEGSQAQAFEDGADAVVSEPIELEALRTVLHIIAPPPRCPDPS